MNRFVSHFPQADGTAFAHNLSSVVLAAAMVFAQGMASAYDSMAHKLPDANPILAGSASFSRPGAVSMDVAHKTLCQVMGEIKARSGAEIKLPANLAGDTVSRPVQGDNWQAALGHLLAGYNYSAVWGKGGQPLQLTVYGRNQNADEQAVATNAARAAAGEDLLIYETAAVELPQKYQSLNPGAVSQVSFPVGRMKQMALGEKVSLNLPCGQFSVVHDKRFQQDNGDVTWVGYLEDAGKAYRVIITMGAAGNYGQVITPGGMYNLDLEQGRTWLVDASAPAAQS